MCGRYALTASADALVQHFQLNQGLYLVPRYNIVPGGPIPVIRSRGSVDFLQWGFIPAWAKGASQTHYTNARIEGIQERPSFRGSFKKRRCLIIATGYYEWKTIGHVKQPYYIQRKDAQVFALAGIWEGETCAILTKSAEAPFLDLHERMPIMISVPAYSAWLDPKSHLEDVVQPILQALQTELVYYPVSTQVNDPHFEGPGCIHPF